MIEERGLPPLSLYVHIPWCIAKCPYCDFHSLPRQGPLPEARYVRALLADLDEAEEGLLGRTVQTVFFGGGTPSLFSAGAINDILAGINRRTALPPSCEITLEANPGTVEAGRFSAFREAGVNRLSLGIQSLQDPFLQALGRIHDSREARAAIEQAASSGFRSFNIDLMYGLPGQGAREALADLREVLSAKPQHLSLYELTIEAHTAFAHKPPTLPDEEEREAIEAVVQGAAASAGLERYEVSAYACPGSRCAHNLNYWEFGDYLGLGAGAHGKLSTAQGVIREVRAPDPERYMKGAERILNRRVLSEADLVFEFLLNALRLTEGFSAKLFTARTGRDFSEYAPSWQSAAAKGLLLIDAEHVRTTPLGRRFLDSLLSSLLASLDPVSLPLGETRHALG